MDTKKLFKAIQILVEAEVMKQLPLIKEQVRKELTEVKSQIAIPKMRKPKQMLSMINAKPKLYSTNPIINEILNETTGGILAQEGDTEYRTMNFNSGDMGKITGEMPTRSNGMPVDVSRDEVKTVMNAMNRDYSSLMGAMAQKKK